MCGALDGRGSTLGASVKRTHLSPERAQAENYFSGALRRRCDGLLSQQRQVHPALGPKDRGTIAHNVFGTHLKFLRSIIWAECFKGTILSSDLQNIRAQS